MTDKKEDSEGFVQLNTRIPISVDRVFREYLRTTPDSKQLSVAKAIRMLLLSAGFVEEEKDSDDERH